LGSYGSFSSSPSGLDDLLNSHISASAVAYVKKSGDCDDLGNHKEPYQMGVVSFGCFHVVDGKGCERPS